MFPQSIKNLINQLSKLPDIGPRAATRLVFYLMNQDKNELDELALSIKEIRNENKLCKQCFNLANNDLCIICSDEKRDKNTICVVETILNIPPIEKTKQYNGVYHVLGGLISPGNGISVENIKIKELINRIENNRTTINELIFALSPTTEGDTTTLYIEKILKPLKIKTSRLARGLSTGSDLEYIDENTLSSAFRGRK